MAAEDNSEKMLCHRSYYAFCIPAPAPGGSGVRIPGQSQTMQPAVLSGAQICSKDRCGLWSKSQSMCLDRLKALAECNKLGAITNMDIEEGVFVDSK